MLKIELPYTPQDRQILLHSTCASEILYGGCVSGDTEYLSPLGWRAIQDYDGGPIAEWSPDGSYEFRVPRHVSFACSELIEFSSRRLTMRLSPDHRVAVTDYSGAFQVKSASYLEAHPSRNRIPVSTRPVAGSLPLNEDEIRLSVAIHADGSFDGSTPNYCRMTLRKPRKRQRLENLLSGMGIEWKEYRNENRPTEVRYSFYSPVTSKTFSDWWGASTEQLEVIIDEMPYWDGSHSGGIAWNGCGKGDADFIQYAAHAIGRHASITTYLPKDEKHQTLYRVNITTEPVAGIILRNQEGRKGTKIRRIPADKMYCFETSTGFWVARCDGHIFCTGNSAGGGKSHSIRWDGYDFCIKNPGCVAVLVRQTLPQLEKNHIRKVRVEIPKELGEYNETRKVLRWWNGSIMAFQHLEYDKDINDFQGDEIHWLGIDEAALLKPEHIAEIRTRLRLGGWKPADALSAKRLPRLVMGSNPGGPAHLWLKKNFIDPARPETVFDHTVSIRGEKIVKTRIFIPATMRDNQYLDTEYEAQFSELPEWKQKQLRDGDWNVVPGAFFDCWDPRKHVVEPFEIPNWWPRYRSCDWGFATPFSIGEWTVSDGSATKTRSGQEVTFPDGCLIRVWEWYGSEDHNNVGLRLDPGFIAAEILQNRGKALPGPGDPSMWRADSGPSFAEKFANSGMPFFRADNKREAGWQEMYRRMKAGMLLVTTDCDDFVRTIPTLTADPMNPDDVLKGGEDHIGDETRYLCMARPMKRTKPKPKRPANDPLRFHDLKLPKGREARWI